MRTRIAVVVGVVVPPSVFARNAILAEAAPHGRARVEFVNDGTPVGRSLWEGSPGEQLLTSFRLVLPAARRGVRSGDVGSRQRRRRACGQVRGEPREYIG